MYGNVISLRTVLRRLQEAHLPVRIASRVRLLRQKKKLLELDCRLQEDISIGPEQTVKQKSETFSAAMKQKLIYLETTVTAMFDGLRVRNSMFALHRRRSSKRVWVYFSWYGDVSIHRIMTMTWFYYRAILVNTMLTYIEESLPLRWTFLQYNNPKHNSKLLKNWFQDNNWFLFDWTNQFPHLNQIKNLWGVLKQRIGKDVFKNKGQLCTILIKETWHEISVETCKKSQQNNWKIILCSDRHFYQVNIRLFVYNILSVQTHNIRNIFLTAGKQNTWLFQQHCFYFGGEN